MKKLVKNIKLMVAVSTMLVMFAVAPVVYGGISWTGIDPILYVNGTKFNVRAELPSEFICSLSDDIEIVVTVPEDASVEFISESSSDFGDCEVETDTEIVWNSDSSPSSFTVAIARCVSRAIVSRNRRVLTPAISWRSMNTGINAGPSSPFKI